MLNDDAAQLAGAFGYRVALREETAAQAEFLKRLSKTALGTGFVLCGSAALHGVFLHGRRVGSIDLLVLPDIAWRFAAILREMDVRVELTEVPRRYRVSLPDRVIHGIPLTVNLFASQLEHRAEEQLFGLSQREKTSVRTMSLVELTARKLATLYLRVNPVDYLDLWLALKQTPTLTEDLRSRMMSCRAVQSSHDPHSYFDCRKALADIAGLEDVWEQALSKLVHSVPDHGSVQKDLRDWLLALDSVSY